MYTVCSVAARQRFITVHQHAQQAGGSDPCTALLGAMREAPAWQPSLTAGLFHAHELSSKEVTAKAPHLRQESAAEWQVASSNDQGSSDETWEGKLLILGVGNAQQAGPSVLGTTAQPGGACHPKACWHQLMSIASVTCQSCSQQSSQPRSQHRHLSDRPVMLGWC